MVPPMSVVSEKSEYMEYSLIGSTVDKSMRGADGQKVRRYTQRGSENFQGSQTLLTNDMTLDAEVDRRIEISKHDNSQESSFGNHGR